jgi:hypothetical protein
MSWKGPFIVLRVLGTLLFIGLIAGGGLMAYRAGVADGVAQAPQVAEAIQQSAENGQGIPYAPMYGHGYGFHHRHHFGFFPFGILGAIFLLFLFFGFMRMIFFGRMHYGGHRHGPWGRHWEEGVPPMFSEWHKRAHKVPEGGGETPSDSDSSEEKK